MGEVIDQIREIIRRWKENRCPYCGSEGKPYLLTRICKKCGIEYWDHEYLQEIVRVLGESGGESS